MLSFIIPTLDEEKNIKRVLQQFESIKGKYDFEVIVADGGSKDKTIEIAKKLGAKVYQNKREKQNIAKNRNLGAKHAKGDILIFCDADTKIKNINFFCKEVISKFKNKNIIAGAPKIRVFPNLETKEDKIFLSLLNYFVEKSFKTKKPIASGQCQIIRKSAFYKIKGYNEKLAYGEDVDLFLRLANLGEFYFFSNLIIYESPRRYRKWGYPKLITTAIGNYLNKVFKGKPKINKWERVD